MRQIICAVLLLGHQVAAQTPRGTGLPPRPAATVTNGSYYSLVIGINAYGNWPQLRTAVNDARAMDATLRQRYGFQSTLLLDDAATRARIMDAFGQYGRRLRENDSLLIYYAGHGTKVADRAYWLPADSEPNTRSNWMSADDINSSLQFIPARHILVIADSCYSGGLSRDVQPNSPPTDHTRLIQSMLSSKSRVLISSGRDEPVADDGGGGHSVFARAVLNGLERTDEQFFTAADLFERYIQEAVVGGSDQVPQYLKLQHSGHEYGDFVFMVRGGAVSGGSVSPGPPDRRNPSPPPKPGPAALPAHASTTRLAADGRSAQAQPADPSGALPLTDYRVSLLEFRDFPQLMTDATMTDIAKWQVIGEQSNWKLLDAAIARGPGPGVQLNPQRSQFVFEWQKYIDVNPAFVGSALLPVFLRQDADWSFLKKEKGWDEQYDAYVYVFLFAREKVEGRQPEFVARELAPVLKKHLQMAVSRAATKLYFDVPLRTQYDVNQGAIRFQQKDGNQFGDSMDLLLSVPEVRFAEGGVQNLPPPADRAYHTTLPAAARGTANYNRTLEMKDTPLARPGVIIYGADPEEVWRKSINGNTQEMHMLPLSAFALDRQLKVSAIPVDPKRAEPIVQILRNLHARVFISADRLDLFQMSYERQAHQQLLMFARVLKVDIVGPKDEVIATIAASALPAPGK